MVALPQTIIAPSVEELMTAVMSDSYNTSGYHVGMATWMDDSLEQLMRMCMDIMDQVMKMRSENTRILTRSARKRTPPALLDGLSQECWTPGKETSGEKAFLDTLKLDLDENADPIKEAVV